MKKIEIVMLTIAILYSIFLLNIFLQAGANFFQKQENNEIYFLGFNQKNFSIFSSSKQECKINNKTSFLESGINVFLSQNYVFVNCSNKTIWFKIENQKNQSVYLKNYSIKIQNSKLAIELNGNSSFFGLYQIPISINKKNEEILYFFKPGKFWIYKEFQINSNNVNVSINFFGKEIKQNLTFEQKYPFIFLITLFFVVIFSLYHFEIDEAFVAITFFIILYFHFILQTSEIFQLLFVFLTFICFAILHKRKRAKIGNIKIEKNAFLFASLFVIFVFLIKAIIGYSSVWGYYYSRMAEETFLHSSPFFFDNLSYLGREFIYPYGYFDFSAGLAKILNVDYLKIEPFIHAFLLFIFAYSTLLIFEKINKSFVGAFLFLSQTFIFITSIISPLHVFSLLFLNLSILFLLSNKKLFSALSLTISFITHSLSIFFFPFFLIPFFKKEKIKEYASILAIAILFAFPFYINFLKTKPIEVAPFSLGLLQPTAGIFTEDLFLLPLLLLSLCVAFFENFLKKENFLAFLMLLLNMLIYRLNIVSVFVISYVVTQTLYKDSKKVFCIFPVLNFFFALLVYSGIKLPCAWGAATDLCIAPMLYVSKFSYSNASTPGYFGHLETFFGKQAVVSDYYVEYAKPKNFYAQENFCKTGNFSYIKDFNVEIIVDSKYYCKQILNSSSFQKVYSNDYFDVFLR